MTTAMDQWAAQRSGEALLDESDHADVSEREIMGATSHDEVTHDETADVPGDEVLSEEDAALQAKRAKDKRIMMIAGGAIAAVGIAFGASLFLGSGPQQQVAQPAQQAPMDPNAVAAAAAQAGSAPVVAAAPAASGEVVAPMDFGLKMPQAAATAPDPATAGMPPAAQFPQPGVVAPEQAAPVLAAAPAVPAPLSAPAGPIGTAHAATLPTMAGAAPAVNAPVSAQFNRADQVEIARLRGEVESVRAEFEKTVAELRNDIAAMRTSAASRPRAAVPARVAPARVAPARSEKPFSGITEKVEPIKPAATPNPDRYVPVAAPVMTDTKATPSAPPPVAKGAKVRNDFTVYAISNGRAWVHWTGDGENHMVSQNSVLPDNSRVTNIDDVKGVVFSSAGEIHAKPSK